MNEYLAWAAKFASPSLVGTTAEGAVQQQLVDENGDPVLDSSNNVINETPEEIMSRALADFRNGSVLAVPFGASVKELTTGASDSGFVNGIRIADYGITRAITNQVLATMEAQHQAKASSETHQDILGMGVLMLKMKLAAVVRKDIFEPLIRYNFGDEAARKFTPYLNLGFGSGFPITPDAIARLVSAKFIHPSQYARIDKMLGLPPRTVETNMNAFGVGAQNV